MANENEEKGKSEEDNNYQVYLDERRALIQAEKTGSQQFDKAILTLAAGALAISLTFVQNLAPHPEKWTIWFLSISWVAFILSILSTLCSFLTSQSAFRKQVKIIEKRLLPSVENLKGNSDSAKGSFDNNNPMAKWTKRLNISSIICFILGIVFLATFSIINIVKLEENKMAKEKTPSILEKGLVPPDPPKKAPKLEGLVPPDPPKEKPPKPKNGK